ncbi:antibiotic biosynthesis monooxygenase [Microbispora sp. RL4-1S]|uniref:Antibiotic biosynthesis monooxygenase n=1 Tax=Microbispora oryzae TaxID=2806554 RepID=A0A941ANE9_9ACTN|nr:antibiotic biosynthesis monooxygenase family protein [Microbispora oryzae]MBP2708283.1 antibiotic biosynthesis monooxygenase [Microbispora oryzae]
MTEPGFRVVLTMHIHPGVEEEFEQAWRAVGAAVTDHPANLGHWLLRSADEKGVYYINSDWVDEKHFREFEESWEHGEHRAKLHPYRASATIATMHVVGHLGKETA